MGTTDNMAEEDIIILQDAPASESKKKASNVNV